MVAHRHVGEYCLELSIRGRHLRSCSSHFNYCVFSGGIWRSCRLDC